MIVVCLIGTALAIFTPITQYEYFLYFISSVFAPMIAIQMTDYFILKRDYSAQNYQVMNLVIWLIGFVVYQLCMSLDTPIGYTVPVMLVISVLSFITHKLVGGKSLCSKQCSKISE